MNSVWRMWSFEVSVYGAISWVFGTMGLAPGRVVCACRIDWGVRERQMVFEAMGVAEITQGGAEGGGRGQRISQRYKCQMRIQGRETE